MIWRVAPVSAPLKARNGEPGSTLIATGAPVIAACFAGSVYIAKRLSAGAGRTTDWEMTVRMDTPEHKIAEHMRRTAQHTLPARLGLSPPSQSSNSKQKLCYHRGLIGEGGAFRYASTHRSEWAWARPRTLSLPCRGAAGGELLLAQNGGARL